MRVAWCAKCEGPRNCDDLGCLECAESARKKVEGMRTLHAQRKQQGRCINNAGHAVPSVRPNGQRFTRCDACREVHRRTW